MSTRFIIRTVLVIAAALFVGVLWLSSSGSERQVRDIVEQCATEKDNAACYEREVPKLYPKLSVSKIFDIVREIRKEDPSYQFCHVLAHKLGEAVVARDPSKWLDAITLNPPDSLCSNGFIHGVIGGRFRAEVLDAETLEALIPDFARACEPRESWGPSSLDQAICYHGMGHLFMFITDANIPKALSLCERTAESVAPNDFRRVCREGIFMQIYQPLEPDDFLMIERMPLKPSATTVRQFCSMFERDEYEGACLRESWPFFRNGIMDGSGIGSFCLGQPNNTEETSCYESVFSILGRQSLGNPEKALEACGKVPEERKEMCYERVALAIVEEDTSSGEQAVSFCKSVPEEYQRGCMESLARRADFVFANEVHRLRFCAAFPRELQTLCAQL